jgi:cell division protein FtsQ
VKARRAKSSAVRRLRPFWIVIITGFGVSAVLIGFAVSWPGFDPRTISVNGNRRVTQAQIVERAGIAPKINMWLQDPRAIARRIETIPDVLSVRVRRIPPATIELSVSERQPFAVVRWGPSEVLVDRELRILSEPPPDGGLPVMVFPLRAGDSPGAFLEEPGLVALRSADDALTAAHVVPVELRFDRFGGLVAVVRGVTVLFGDQADLDKKIPLVNPILAQVDRGERRVSSLDLRAPATPVVRYR